MPGSGETPWRLADDGLQVVAALVGGDARAAPLACVSRGSLVAAAPLPRLLPAVEQQRICAARRRTGWGPRLIAGETGHAHATVWRTLRRAGISRPPKQPREQPRRYEWPCPGDLLHIDSKRFVRFSQARPRGHR